MERRSQLGVLGGNSLSSNSIGGSERQKRADRRSQSKHTGKKGACGSLESSCCYSAFWGTMLYREPGSRIDSTMTEPPRVHTGSYYSVAVGKPTYFLLESACGYALVVSHGVDKIEDNYESLEKYISRFDQVFQLVAYHTFDTPEHAMHFCTAISRGIVTEELMTFLIDNLPKVCYVDGLPCCMLAVGCPYLMDPIFKKTRMCCISGILHNNIIRGIRFNISKIVEEWKPEVIRKAEQDLARLYNSKQRI